jgi:hypothetical protein
LSVGQEGGRDRQRDDREFDREFDSVRDSALLAEHDAEALEEDNLIFEPNSQARHLQQLALSLRRLQAARHANDARAAAPPARPAEAAADAPCDDTRGRQEGVPGLGLETSLTHMHTHTCTHTPGRESSLMGAPDLPPAPLARSSRNWSWNGGLLGAPEEEEVAKEQQRDALSETFPPMLAAAHRPHPQFHSSPHPLHHQGESTPPQVSQGSEQVRGQGAEVSSRSPALAPLRPPPPQQLQQYQQPPQQYQQPPPQYKQVQAHGSHPMLQQQASLMPAPTQTPAPLQRQAMQPTRQHQEQAQPHQQQESSRQRQDAQQRHEPQQYHKQAVYPAPPTSEPPPAGRSNGCQLAGGRVFE